MEEFLSWEEIQRRYAGQWVVVDDPKVTDDLEILGGRVVFHGDSRDEAHEEIMARGLKSFAIWFLGPPIPEGLAAIL